MQQYINKATEVVKLKNVSVRKSSLRIEVLRAEPAVANQGVDLSKIQITVQVNQKGVKTQTSFNALPAYNFGFIDKGYTSKVENLAPLVALGVSASAGQVIVTGGQAIQMFDIPITKYPFILSETDTMNVTIQILAGAFGSANIESTVYFVTEDGTNLNQEAVVLPEYIPVVDSTTQVRQYMGTVARLAIFNSNNATSDLADFVWNNIDINSKFYNDEKTANQMAQDSADFSARLNFIDLFKKDGAFLKDLTLNGNVQVAKVVSGVDYIYAEVINPSFLLLADSDKRAKKIKHDQIRTLSM